MAARRLSSSGGSFIVTTAFGQAVALWCSWQLGNSLGWILLHGLFGWLYLLYLCGGCGGGFPPIGTP